MSPSLSSSFVLSPRWTRDVVISFSFFSHCFLLLVPGFCCHRETHRHILKFADGTQSFFSLVENDERFFFFMWPVVDPGVQLLFFHKQNAPSSMLPGQDGSGSCANKKRSNRPVKDFWQVSGSSLQTSEHRQVVRKHLGSAAAGEHHPVHSE